MKTTGISLVDVENALLDPVSNVIPNAVDVGHEWVIGEASPGRLISVDYEVRGEAKFLLQVVTATSDSLARFIRRSRPFVSTDEASWIRVETGPFAGLGIVYGRELEKAFAWLFELDRADVAEAFAKSRGGLESDRAPGRRWFATRIRRYVIVRVTYEVLADGRILVLELARDAGKALQSYERRSKKF